MLLFLLGFIGFRILHLRKPKSWFQSTTCFEKSQIFLYKRLSSKTKIEYKSSTFQSIIDQNVRNSLIKENHASFSVKEPFYKVF